MSGQMLAHHFAECTCVTVLGTCLDLHCEILGGRIGVVITIVVL